MFKFPWSKQKETPLPVIQEAAKDMTNIGLGSLPTYERGSQYSPIYYNYSVFQNSPYWQRLTGMQSLFDWYHKNPVFYAIVQIKARASANRKFFVKNRKTGKVEPESTLKTIPAMIYKLLNQPNPLQSRWEFLKQKKIFDEVCGNSLTYGNAPMGFKPSINNIKTFWNIWPQYMQFELTGKYFDATEKSDIIKKWKFEYGTYKKEFTADEILHQNQPNTEIRDGLIFGRGTATTLTRPLSNIDMAYESRNVMMRNRGMRIILTSDKSDDSGNVPLMPDEKKQVDEAMKNYGMLEGQSQFFFSTMPLKAVPIDQDVMKLGLFEEIAQDAMICCNAWGVPEVLLKLYLEGATFENQDIAVKRLYQDTLIPEAKDDDIALNNFLRLDETEWYVESSFDHIPVLQKSKKEEAQASKDASTYLERLFLIGGITLNQWLNEIDLPELPNGNRTIMEMTPEERDHILSVLSKSSGQNASDQGQNSGSQNQKNGFNLKHINHAEN